MNLFLYMHIYINNKGEIVFNDDVIYLSHIKHKSFYDTVICLVQNQKVLQLTNSETYQPIIWKIGTKMHLQS